MLVRIKAGLAIGVPVGSGASKEMQLVGEADTLLNTDHVVTVHDHGAGLVAIRLANAGENRDGGVFYVRGTLDQVQDILLGRNATSTV